MRVALQTGASTTRAINASAQRCVNLFMEKNPEDAPFPFTCYPTPGTAEVTREGEGGRGASTVFAGWRGLFVSTKGRLYGVCGRTVYRVQDDFTLTVLGKVTTDSGRVVMEDNNNYVLLVDGSTNGYAIDMSNDTLSIIPDSDFVGGNTVAFLDGYFILNKPDSVQWYISGANTMDFDPLDFASKSAYLDPLVGVAVANRYLFLFGQDTTEVWFNAGATAFPFERLPGVYMQYGCAAVGSIAQMGGVIYWLARSPQGQAMVCRTEQFQAVQVSTFALNNEISTYGDLSTAMSYTYQMNGHYFYVISFPDAGKTWQYDSSTQQWNELSFCDANGQESRHRASTHAFFNGQHIVGDYQNGKLYRFDLNVYTDDTGPIVRRRGFFHGVDNDFFRISYKEFTLDMEPGLAPPNENQVQVYLHWSNDRGRTFGNPVAQSLGLTGEFLTTLQFQRLGAARDRVFEVFWSAPVRTALLGAYVQFSSNNQ